MKKILFFLISMLLGVCTLSASLVKNVNTAGTLSELLKSYDITTLKSLKITGNLNVNDIKYLNSLSYLKYLDIQDVKIRAYGTAYKEDCFPARGLEYSDIDTVLLPKSIVSIGNASFYYSYTSVLQIPNSVANIDEFAFAYCRNLKSIQLPSSLKKISQYAFYNTVMENMLIPDSVTSIGQHCFENMWSLKTIKLPKQIKEIGNDAISYTTELECITMPGLVPPVITSSAINNCASNCKIIVPKGALHLYMESMFGKLNIPIEEGLSSNKLSQNYFNLNSKSVVTGKIVVTTDSVWKISNISDCITFDKLSGEGQDEITYSIQPNYGISVKNAFAHISFNNSEEQLIHFHQSGNTYVCKNLIPGGLSDQIPDSILKVVDQLIISGEVNAKDFQILKTKSPLLRFIDLSEVKIKEYTGFEGTKPGNLEQTMTYPADFIPQCAFQSSSITRIKLPETLIGIDTSAFKNCIIDTIRLPENLKYIRANSFENSFNLKKLYKGDNVPVLESYAFRNCTQLESINFNKVKSIHPYCFENCSSLTSPKFTEDLLKIYHDAFKSCISIKKVVIPDSVNTVNSYSFGYCTTLDTIILGARIKAIGEFAFEGSSNFRFVESRNATPPDFEISSFPKRFTILVPYNCKQRYENSGYWSGFATIVENTSGFCFNKTPDALNYNNNSTTALQFTVTPDIKEEWTITANQPWIICTPSHGSGSATVTVKSLLNPAFTKRSVVVTISFTSIPPRDITIYQNASPKTINTDAGQLSTYLSAKEITDLTSLVVNGTINELDMKFLREKMQQLQELDLSGARIDSCIIDNVKYDSNRINKLQLLKLLKLQLPKTITRISYQAFLNCPSLKTLDMGDSLKIVGGESFMNCTSLRYIHFSQSLETIANSAFKGCSSLDSLCLPKSLKFLDYMAFYDCSFLKRIYCFTPYFRNMLSAFNTAKQIKVYVLYKMKHGFSFFSSYFDSLLEMKSIEYFTEPVIINSINTKEIAIPVSSNTNWSISKTCDWLHINKSTGNGNDTVYISADANISQHVRFSDLVFKCELQDDVRLRIVQKIGVRTITAVAGHLTDSITAIDGENIDNMIIDGTLNAYDFRLFKQTFPKLQRLDLHNARIVEYNGTEGTNLTNQSYYPDNEIPPYSFYNSNRVSVLKRVILPDNLRSISNNAFQDCIQLDSLVIPAGVQTINKGALWGTGISNIKLPPLANLNEYLFVNCSKLTSVEIPDIVTTIDWAAFQNCTSLKSVKLSRNLTKIDSYAFNQCTSLKEVYVFQKIPIDISNSVFVFKDIDAQCVLYVPNGCKDIYKTQAGWSNFRNIQEMPIDNEKVESVSPLNIYPNPASEVLNISGIDKPQKIRIFTQSGIKVYEQVVSTKLVLDVSHLSIGAYYIVVGNNTHVYKFLKH